MLIVVYACFVLIFSSSVRLYQVPSRRLYRFFFDPLPSPTQFWHYHQRLQHEFFLHDLSITSPTSPSSSFPSLFVFTLAVSTDFLSGCVHLWLGGRVLPPQDSVERSQKRERHGGRGVVGCWRLYVCVRTLFPLRCVCPARVYLEYDDCYNGTSTRNIPTTPTSP